MLDEFKILKNVVQKLNENKIPYMISGSVAMNYYTQPRMTRDIDIVIEAKDADKFYNLFKQDYYIDLEMIKNAIANQQMFNIIHLKEVIKIDFIIKKSSEYRITEFSRKKKVKIDNFYIFIVSIEDLVISKLVWVKNSCSEVQLRDVSNLLKEKVDLDYIKKWSGKLKLSDLLERIIHGS
jgi:hypothetical protein